MAKLRHLLTITVDRESRTFMCLIKLTTDIANRTYLGMMRHAHSTGLHPSLMVVAGMTPLLATAAFRRSAQEPISSKEFEGKEKLLNKMFRMKKPQHRQTVVSQHGEPNSMRRRQSVA